MDFENLNKRMGGCGRYQYISFFILSLTTFKFSSDFQATTFALFVPKFQCSVDKTNSTRNTNVTFSQDQCKYKLADNQSWVSCTQWTFDKDVLKESFVSEFVFVCDNEYHRNLVFCVYFLGNLASYPLIIFTDKLGRRIILIIFIFFSTAVSIGQTLAHALWLQYMLAFISGFIRPVCTTLAFTIVIEIVSMNKVDIAATNFWIPYTLAYMSAALFAYVGRSWRSIIWFGLFITAAHPFYFFFVPETPRWLMLNKKREQAFKTMTFMAKINRRSLSRAEFDEWTPVNEPTGKFWNIFKYKIMIYRLLILNLAAWSFAFAYIGSSTDLTFASNNIFLTTFVMGVIEFPACPVAGFLANRFGRKPSLCGLCILGIISLIPLPFLEADVAKSSWQPWVKLVAAMGAKFGFVGGWAIFDIIINETMPTTDRNAAMSLVYIAVGLGSIVAPMIHNESLKLYFALPCLMYALLLILTVIFVWFFIPETHLLPVPQTLEQAVALKIHKEQEWKENMIKEAQEMGMDKISVSTDISKF